MALMSQAPVSNPFASLSSAGELPKVRLLVMGPSGSGKTSSLLSLVRAGYSLFIIDIENGLDVFRTSLTPEENRRVNVVNIPRQKEINSSSLNSPVARDTAFRMITSAIEYLSKNPDTTGKSILVIETLTSLSTACLDCIVATRPSKSGEQGISQPQWGMAQNLLDNLTATITSTVFPHHLIMTSHVTFDKDPTGAIIKGYPSAIGDKQPRSYARHFNNQIIVSRAIPSGVPTLSIVPTSLLDAKCAAWGKLPPSLPVDTGLADIFNALTSN